jgi:hypothetical protein
MAALMEYSTLVKTRESMLANMIRMIYLVTGHMTWTLCLSIIQCTCVSEHLVYIYIVFGFFSRPLYSFHIFFSDFQLFRPEYHRRDLNSRNAHLVHQNWYRISFALHFVCFIVFVFMIL